MLRNGGERGHAFLCPKGLAYQIDFVGNCEMEGTCRLPNNCPMTSATDGSHAVRVGRLPDQTGMGGILGAGLDIAIVAIVTRKIVVPTHCQWMTATTAMNRLRFDLIAGDVAPGRGIIRCAAII